MYPTCSWAAFYTIRTCAVEILSGKGLWRFANYLVYFDRDQNPVDHDRLIHSWRERTGTTTWVCSRRADAAALSCRLPAGVSREGQSSWVSSQRSASMAAMQPDPAAVTAWRYTVSCTSPQANTPSTLVRLEPFSARI